MPRLAIPALSFRDDDGCLDMLATAAYAERAAATWISTFLLSGTTTQGESFSITERNEVLDLWLEVVPPERLFACCWGPSDLLAAVLRDITPVVVMRDLNSAQDVLAFFEMLPEGTYVYSNPLYTASTLDAGVLARAKAVGVMPAGAKITKIAKGALPGLRAVAGPEFDLWDGSSRDIAVSLAKGASGVFSAPLAAIPEPFPQPGPGLQAVVDQWQARLDEVSDEAERAAWLRASFR